MRVPDYPEKSQVEKGRGDEKGEKITPERSPESDWVAFGIGDLEPGEFSAPGLAGPADEISEIPENPAPRENVGAGKISSIVKEPSLALQNPTIDD